MQILLIAVISIASAENVGRSVRAPQGQINYDNSGEYEVCLLSKICLENLGPDVSQLNIAAIITHARVDFHISDL